MSLRQLDLFVDTIPRKPYCTDELGSLLIRPAMQALKLRYVQHNAPWELRWMVYDVDRCTASFDWYDLDAPPPNIVATNRTNGHAHLFYGLEVAVLQGLRDRQSPMRYAAAVDIALTEKLDADRGYAKLLSKNPKHNDWWVQVYQPESYDLEWLADYLDLGQLADRRRRLPDVGYGRNVNLFNDVRRWAYREIRKPNSWFGFEFWHSAVASQAYGHNDGLTDPLPSSEVKSTAKSIAKWTWRNMSPQRFREWAKRRNRASQRVRKARATERVQQILKLKSEQPEWSNRRIARAMGVSEITVRRAMKPASI